MADRQIHQLAPGTYSASARIPQQRLSGATWVDEYIEPSAFSVGGGGLTPVLKPQDSADFTAENGKLYICSGTTSTKISCPVGGNVGDRFGAASIVNGLNFSIRSPSDATVYQGANQLLSTDTNKGIVNLSGGNGYSYIELIKVAADLWYATIQIRVDVQFDSGGPPN